MSGRRFTTLLLFLLLPLVLPVSVRGQDVRAAAESTSCLRCHGRFDGRLGDPVQSWQGSIHAVNGIGCHSCHGGDPSIDSMEAMSPARGFVGVPPDEQVPAFCGKCHAGVEEDYRESAHGQALGAGGPQCVTCHGNHAVRQATIELINPESCTECHGYERAEEIREALAQTDAMISGLDRDISRLHRVGIETEEMRGSLFAVRNDFHRLFHSVDVAKVVSQTEGFQARLAEIRQGVDTVLETLSQRRLAGGMVVGLLALTTVVCWLLRRTYQEEEEMEREEGL